MNRCLPEVNDGPLVPTRTSAHCVPDGDDSPAFAAASFVSVRETRLAVVMDSSIRNG